MQATADLLYRRGLDGTNMDAIAAVAGVSKPTIYRRWASKEELIVDVMSARPQSAFDQEADEPDPRAGLVRVAMRLLSWGGASGASILPHLREVLDERLARIFEDRVIEPRRHEIRRLIARAVELGQLRADVDMDMAIDLLFGGVMFYRVRASQHMGPDYSDLDVAERIVATLWSGMRTEATPAALGSPRGRS